MAVFYDRFVLPKIVRIAQRLAVGLISIDEATAATKGAIDDAARFMRKTGALS